MENASKALLIAGGILIIIILVSLILIVRNNVTNFYASQDELQMTTDRAKFNEQFTRYNRDDVEGYELESLINKVSDYNERMSTATENGNNVQAEPVTLKINLGSDELRKDKFSYDTDNLYLITMQTYEQSNSKEQFQSNIKIKIKDLIEQYYKSEDVVRNISKNIKSIFLSDSEIQSIINAKGLTEEQVKKEAIDKYNSFIKDSSKKIEGSSVAESWSYLTQASERRKAVYAYYEYAQFKKAKFKCTKMDYSQTTGRVTNLEFVFTGEIE